MHFFMGFLSLCSVRSVWWGGLVSVRRRFRGELPWGKDINEIRYPSSPKSHGDHYWEGCVHAYSRSWSRGKLYSPIPKEFRRKLQSQRR